MTELTPEKRAELRRLAVALAATEGVGHERERAFKWLHLELTETVVLSLLDALDAAEVKSPAYGARDRHRHELMGEILEMARKSDGQWVSLEALYAYWPKETR